MAKGISTKRIKRGISRVLTFLLLVLYTAGTSHFELLHSFVHHHDVAVTHTEEQENSPCHNDSKQSCDHDSHLLVSDKCQMCDLAYHGDQTILSNVVFSAGNFPSEHVDFYKLSLHSYRAVLSSSRAPPVFA